MVVVCVGVEVLFVGGFGCIFFIDGSGEFYVFWCFYGWSFWFFVGCCFGDGFVVFFVFGGSIGVVEFCVVVVLFYVFGRIVCFGSLIFGVVFFYVYGVC